MPRPRLSQLLLALVLFGATALPALANPSGCPQFYAGGAAPDFVNAKLARAARELCNEAFAVVHSGAARTPLWAAEHLTRDGLAAARGLPRTNQFYADPRLPATERAELSDYARSGFDRGHLAPAANMPTASAMAQSFALSNMIPQDADCNQSLWAGIESAVRYETKKRGELYVITGPLFTGSGQALQGRVLIPTGLFKAVYDPARQEGAAYVAANAPGGGYTIKSLGELAALTGLELFPGIPEPAKDRPMRLPKPRLRH